MAVKWPIRELVGKMYLYKVSSDDPVAQDLAADAYFDTNPASVSNKDHPYGTVNAMISRMNTDSRFTNNNCNFIIDNSVVSETISSTRSKGMVTWWGAEDTIIDGSTASRFQAEPTDIFNFFTIRNYPKTTSGNGFYRQVNSSGSECRFCKFEDTLILGVSDSAIYITPFFYHCSVRNSDLMIQTGNRRVSLYAENTAFENIVATPYYAVNSSSNSYNSVYSLKNCHFKNFNTVIRYNALNSFNFNNIEGTITIKEVDNSNVTYDQAALVGIGVNVDGMAVDANTLCFNNPAAKDFTLKPDSPFLLAGEGGKNIGPYERGFSFTAQTVWDNRANDNGGFTVTNGKITKLPVPAIGTFETEDFHFSQPIRLGSLRIGSLYSYNTAGKLQESLLPAGASGVGGRDPLVIEFKSWMDNESKPAAFKRIIINRAAFLDDAGNATGDDNVNLDEFNSIITENLCLFFTAQ